MSIQVKFPIEVRGCLAPANRGNWKFSSPSGQHRPIYRKLLRSETACILLHIQGYQHADKEGQADVAVDIEESQVDVAQVIGTHQAVLPDQQRANDNEANPERPGQAP